MLELTLVKDIYPGYYGSSPDYLTAVGDQLFFTADDGTNGTELWMSNGTEAGTQLVENIGFGSDYIPYFDQPAATENLLFF